MKGTENKRNKANRRKAPRANKINKIVRTDSEMRVPSGTSATESPAW